MVNNATANVATVTWMTSQKLFREGSSSLASVYQTVIAIPRVSSTGPMTMNRQAPHGGGGDEQQTTQPGEHHRDTGRLPSPRLVSSVGGRDRIRGGSGGGARPDQRRLLLGLGSRHSEPGCRAGQVDGKRDHGDGEHGHGRVDGQVGVLRESLVRHIFVPLPFVPLPLVPVRCAMASSRSSIVAASPGSSPLARPPIVTTVRRPLGWTRTNTRRRRITSEAISPASAAMAPLSASSLPGS